MVSSLLSILIVVGELLLALAVVFAVFVWRVSARRKRQRSAAERLVGKLRNSKNDRLERVRATLSAKYGLEGEELEEKAQRLVSLEKSLFARFLRAFLGRDDEGVTVLDESVDALVGAYAELSPAAPADADQTQALQEANAELTAERDRLQEQLRQANESMDAMAREYVSVYRGSGGSKLKGAGGEDAPEGGSEEAATAPVESSMEAEPGSGEPTSGAAETPDEPGSDAGEDSTVEGKPGNPA